MNSFGDAAAGSPARDFFFITPGWRRLRLAEALEAGVQYRNYVRMVPIKGEPGAYAGDMYLLRGKVVVVLCQGIKFKRVPRALMPVMFARRGIGGGSEVVKTKMNPLPSPRTPRAPVEATPISTSTVTKTAPAITTPPSAPSEA